MTFREVGVVMEVVDIGFISILIAVVLLGLSVGWFLHRHFFNIKFFNLKEKCSLVEKELAVVTSRYKELDAKAMRFQYESAEVVKKLNTKKAVLEKLCQKLEGGNNHLSDQNADIARKITQLYQAKQTEIGKLHSKIELAKSRGSIATTSSQEIQFLKQTVERLESLLIDESSHYEKQINELEDRLCEMQPLDVLAAPATIEPDDLTEISGIGPKLKKFLSEFGIVSFYQLANMSNEELIRLSDELGDFGDRIVRDKWIEQAKLLNEKYH